MSVYSHETSPRRRLSARATQHNYTSGPGVSRPIDATGQYNPFRFRRHLNLRDGADDGGRRLLLRFSGRVELDRRPRCEGRKSGCCGAAGWLGCGGRWGGRGCCGLDW